MKILVLSNLYPPAAVGGYERMCRDVVERFRGAGHTVVVLTTTFGEPTQESDPEVHRLLGIYWNDSSIECPSLGQLFRCERANQQSFSRLLASFQPDLVSVWGMGAMSLGLLATAQASGLPIVYVVGDDWLVFGRWADCWTRQLDARSTSRPSARRPSSSGIVRDERHVVLRERLHATTSVGRKRRRGDGSTSDPCRDRPS
jgi:hypothetical protein